MKILFLTTAHNSLSQRLLIELTDRGHEVDVTLASSDEAMLKGAIENEPELIIAPMLKASIPKAITDKHLCLIVHPGIMGDRGPSSLDWAIRNGETVWGVSILQAYEEWDAGPIFATREFTVPTPAVAKSQLYRQEVTEAAVAAVLEAIEKIQTPRICAAAARLFAPGRARNLASADASGRSRHRLEPGYDGDDRRQDQQRRQRAGRARSLLRGRLLSLWRACRRSAERRGRRDPRAAGRRRSASGQGTARSGSRI